LEQGATVARKAFWSKHRALVGFGVIALSSAAFLGKGLFDTRGQAAQRTSRAASIHVCD
jgi:hypothetical protein